MLLFRFQFAKRIGRISQWNHTQLQTKAATERNIARKIVTEVLNELGRDKWQVRYSQLRLSSVANGRSFELRSSSTTLEIALKLGHGLLRPHLETKWYC